jgi:hypothetical protein
VQLPLQHSAWPPQGSRIGRHKQLAHLPRQSQSWFSRWRRRSRLLTQRVRALATSQSPVAVLGTWQTRTQSSSARAREGISAAMAVPAKSFSTPRRLREPSARARARSSKVRLVGSWLTCCPPSPKDGARGLAPPSCTTKVSMKGYKPWRNFREFYEGELRRIPILRSRVNKGR